MVTLTAPPRVFGNASGRVVQHGGATGLADPSMPLRRLFVLVLLLLSFALAFGVMVRAHRDLALRSPGDHEAPAAAADALLP